VTYIPTFQIIVFVVWKFILCS